MTTTLMNLNYIGVEYPLVYRPTHIGGKLDMPFRTKAHINSLHGLIDEITVLEDLGNNDYIVDYKGVRCHALFN